MRDLLKHLDVISEAETQIKNLAQQLDDLVDDLEDDQPAKDADKTPRQYGSPKTLGRTRQK